MHNTAADAGGSPRFVASASAARRASNALAYAGLSTIGLAGGGASFASTPRPPPSGTQAPVRLAELFDCASPVMPGASVRTVRTAAATRVMAAITALATSSLRYWRGLGGHAGADTVGPAVSKHAAIRQCNPRQQAARLAALQRAHDGTDLVALPDAVELPAAALEDARAAKLDRP